MTGMPQAIAETVFDVLYLVGVITVGAVLFRKGKNLPLVRSFGLMAIVLGSGDAFHLAPRVYALWTTGVEANAAALGIGKLVTSITMTVFYLMLYGIWRQRYHVEGRKGLTITMWVLTLVRIGLCLLPQNQWLSSNPPLMYGILRNIPFAVMGVLMIVLFAVEAKAAKDKVFRFMPLAIALSFAFYIPVVLWADVAPAVGMLMIPKTLAYCWIVAMGWRLLREQEALRG